MKIRQRPTRQDTPCLRINGAYSLSKLEARRSAGAGNRLILRRYVYLAHKILQISLTAARRDNTLRAPNAKPPDPAILAPPLPQSLRQLWRANLGEGLGKQETHENTNSFPHHVALCSNRHRHFNKVGSGSMPAAGRHLFYLRIPRLHH